MFCEVTSRFFAHVGIATKRLKEKVLQPSNEDIFLLCSIRGGFSPVMTFYRSRDRNKTTRKRLLIAAQANRDEGELTMMNAVNEIMRHSSDIIHARMPLKVKFVHAKSGKRRSLIHFHFPLIFIINNHKVSL